jgi:hypothetical protein
MLKIKENSPLTFSSPRQFVIPAKYHDITIYADTLTTEDYEEEGKCLTLSQNNKTICQIGFDHTEEIFVKDISDDDLETFKIYIV